MTFIICLQRLVFKLVMNLGIWKILTSSSWVLRKFLLMLSSLSKKKNKIAWISPECGLPVIIVSVVLNQVFDSTKSFDLRDALTP